MALSFFTGMTIETVGRAAGSGPRPALAWPAFSGTLFMVFRLSCRRSGASEAECHQKEAQVSARRAGGLTPTRCTDTPVEPRDAAPAH